MTESTDESSTLLTMSPSRAHEEHKENDTKNEETINQEARTLESYLKFAGFGVFHVFLVLVSGLATAADAVEIFGVSFVVPIAEDDLNLSTGDKGWLDASIFIGMPVYRMGCMFNAILMTTPTLMVGRKECTPYTVSCLIIRGKIGMQPYTKFSLYLPPLLRQERVWGYILSCPIYLQLQQGVTCKG